MDAIRGCKTIQEIAADHAIHPTQVSQWRRQLLDGAGVPLTQGKKTKDKEDGQAKEAELFQQIVARRAAEGVAMRPEPERLAAAE